MAVFIVVIGRKTSWWTRDRNGKYISVNWRKEADATHPNFQKCGHYRHFLIWAEIVHWDKILQKEYCNRARWFPRSGAVVSVGSDHCWCWIVDTGKWRNRHLFDIHSSRINNRGQHWAAHSVLCYRKNDSIHHTFIQNPYGENLNQTRPVDPSELSSPVPAIEWPDLLVPSAVCCLREPRLILFCQARYTSIHNSPVCTRTLHCTAATLTNCACDGGSEYMWLADETGSAGSVHPPGGCEVIAQLTRHPNVEQGTRTAYACAWRLILRRTSI